MAKKFSSGRSFREKALAATLARKWRGLVAFINTWTVRFDTDGTTVTLPGQLVVTSFDLANGVALGGGAAPTLGTIGGSGPTTAAQAQWLEVDINGTTHWIAVWV